MPGIGASEQRSDSGPAGGSSLDPAQEAARQALEHVEIDNVVPTSIHAEKSLESVRQAASLRLRIGYRVSTGPGMFHCSYRYEAELLSNDVERTEGAEDPERAEDAEGAVSSDADHDAEAVASFGFVIDVRFAVNSQDYEVPEEAARYLARTTGMLAVHPYARQLLQDLTTRLQCDPTVLGLVYRTMEGAQPPVGTPSDERSR